VRASLVPHERRVPVLGLPEIVQELINDRSGGDNSASVINDAFRRVAVPGRMSNEAWG
jgi:hypothetical protein